MRRREFITLVGGGAAAWPLAARAQQSAMPVIGVLVGGAAAPLQPALAGFRRGLAESGYVEGQNVTIDYRFAEGRLERLPMLASDLVARPVAVLVVSSPDAALAAKHATATIPIVFSIGGDPGSPRPCSPLRRAGRDPDRGFPFNKAAHRDEAATVPQPA